MAAKQRKSLSESLEPEMTPEMEAFRKGSVAPEKVEKEEKVTEPVVETKKPKRHRKLVIELEEDLYDAFATTCFQEKKKMAHIVRAFVEGYIKKN